MLYQIWERYRVILLTLGILLFVTLSFWFYEPDSDSYHPMETSVYASEKPSETTPPLPQKKDEPGNLPMYVDVKGSVKKPGLYPMIANERISHIVEKAGGFLPDADLLRVNLAQPLADGMMVYVPAKGQASPCTSSHSLPDRAAPSASSQPQPSKLAGKTVNINTADVKSLMTLPGVGELRARTIIAYREKNGPFSSPEQLKKVSGIGEKTFEKLKSKISVN